MVAQSLLASGDDAEPRRAPGPRRQHPVQRFKTILALFRFHETHSMKLSGKTALVTGGATGIGLGIAVALAQEGCRVAISGRREDKLREAAARFQGAPPLVYRPADVGDLKSVESLVAWATDELGPLDIVVNSAGVNVLRRTLEVAGYPVTQVTNITDFGHLTSDADEGDDKMTQGL
ncbi:MAG: hypothetical protein B7Z73_16810, partial [Planctomycetia bacterium 21-64-5]